MKSKQSIRILIGLMSLALIAVMLIQFLWIRNAVELRHEQFDRTVHNALASVGTDLQHTYGVHFIAQKLQNDSSARNEVMKQDPGFYQFMMAVDHTQPRNKSKAKQGNENHAGEDMIENADFNASADDVSISLDSTVLPSGPHNVYITTVKKGKDEKTTQVIYIATGKGAYHVIHKKIVEPPNPPQPPVLPITSVKEAVASVPATVAMATAKASKPCKDSSCQLMNIVKSAADEWAMSKMSMQDISDSIKIRTALKKEFVRYGLPQDFVFAVYCVPGDTLWVNKGSSQHPLKDYTFQSPLLGNGLADANSLLLVNFPTQAQYCYSSLSGMLALSLFFTILILSAFAYSLLVIFRQKKLSDITNDFINNMTHELKTPLATISMTADTLGLDSVNKNPGMVSDYSGTIKNEVKKLSRHVDRILESAVLEKNGNGNRMEVISINQLLLDEIKVFAPLVEQKSGSLQSTIPGQDIKVRANKDLLRGAICNLLDNAIKYSKIIPLIKITAKSVEEKVVLSVEDNGIGISKGDQKMIFEKFYRAGTGNRHDVKGFGLGLSFVKSVVENLGGKIWVESEQGIGSKFFIELPVVL
jgi:two-component system phosphate regulon sensor histidine kinase PhoR